MKSFLAKLKREDGYAVAEFAVTVPILVMVSSVCLWAIGISITKFQLESFVHQQARLVARGEILPEEFNQSAPNGTTVNVIELEEKVRVEAQVTKQIPLINKEIELNSSAESMLEVYEFQE